MGALSKIRFRLYISADITLHMGCVSECITLHMGCVSDCITLHMGCVSGCITIPRTVSVPV